MWPASCKNIATHYNVRTLLVNDDQPRAEDAKEAGADKDGQGDEEHEHVDLVRLLQVEVGRDKVTLARCVVAGKSRLGRVVSPVIAKVSEERLCLREKYELFGKGRRPVENGAFFGEGV